MAKIQFEFDSEYIDTSQRIDFISSQNMNAMDIIDYCLRMGVSEKDPPTYFLTRFSDNKSMLFNMKSQSQHLLNIVNKFNVSSDSNR